MLKKMKSSRLAAAPRWLLPGTAALAAAVALVALVLAGWFGQSWWHARFSERPAAQAREEVLDAARQTAVNISSYDSANLDASFANIDSSVMGDLAQQFKDNREALSQALAQQQASSHATVASAAVVELNRDEGTAKAVVVMRQVTTRPGQPDTTALLTSLLTLEEVDGVWKASEAQPLGNTSLDPPQALEQPAVPEQPAAPEQPALPESGGN